VEQFDEYPLGGDTGFHLWCILVKSLDRKGKQI